MEVLRSFDALSTRVKPPTVFTVGFFDGLHRGHQKLLKALVGAAQARSAASLVITFSNSPRGYHNPDKQYPYLTMPEEKIHLLERSGVDATLMIEYGAAIASQRAAEFIEGLGGYIDVIGFCVGYDSKLGSDQIHGQTAYERLAAQLGIDLIFVEALTERGRPVKSRESRGLTRRGDVAGAREVLGHPYFVMGKVQRGKGKGGRRLRVPTANLMLPPEKLAPPTGIYVGIADVAGGRYPAAICVMSSQLQLRTALELGEASTRTVEVGGAFVVETHAIGFQGSLYGELLKVEFIEHLRDWIAFDSVEALHAQIERDIAAAREVIALEPALMAPGGGFG